MSSVEPHPGVESTCMCPVQGDDPLGDRAHGVVVGVEGAAAVVAQLHEQVPSVAVPLDPDASGHPVVDQGEHGRPDDGTGAVRDVSGERAARRRRLHELHVEVAEPDERAQVGPEPRERAGDRFEQGAPLAVGDRPQFDQRPRTRSRRPRRVRRCPTGGSSGARRGPTRASVRAGRPAPRRSGRARTPRSGCRCVLVGSHGDEPTRPTRTDGPVRSGGGTAWPGSGAPRRGRARSSSWPTPPSETPST